MASYGFLFGCVFSVGAFYLRSPTKKSIAPSSASSPTSPSSASSSIDAAISTLRTHFGDRASICLSTDATDLESKGFSSWCQHAASLPSVVAFPESTDDVVAIVNAARNHGVPLLPFAGGTSLEAHWYAPRFEGEGESGETRPSISVCFERMAEILEVDEENGMARVQPGVGWQDLNEELKERGSRLFWPIDPGPGACFGGMLATGGSGTGAVRYGTMKGELVLNVTVVLPSGKVIKTRSDARKSSAGPDLTRLFLGSEGTLGVITEATLRLVPRLEESVTTVSFPTVEDASKAARAVLYKGIAVSSVELLDEVMIRSINQASSQTGSSSRQPLAEQPSLFLKFAGSSPANVKEDQRMAREVVLEHKADPATLRISSSPQEVEELWEARKVALWSAMASREGREEGKGQPRAWTTDVCVPVARLPDLVRRLKADVAEHGLFAPIVGHVGDGNVHAIFVYPDGDSEELAAVTESVHRMVEWAQQLGGTCTGEHGVGRGKREFLEAELGSGTLGLLREIKGLIDPEGFMNPGALLPPKGSERRGEQGSPLAKHAT